MHMYLHICVGTQSIHIANTHAYYILYTYVQRSNTQNHTVREFTLMHINLWIVIAEATCMTEDIYSF